MDVIGFYGNANLKMVWGGHTFWATYDHRITDSSVGLSGLTTGIEGVDALAVYRDPFTNEATGYGNQDLVDSNTVDIITRTPLSVFL